MKYLAACVISVLIFTVGVLGFETKRKADTHRSYFEVRQCAYREPEYVHIRLLALKHCTQQMADDDANLAIKAVERAAAKGLPIKTIGNHFINHDGKLRVAEYDFDWDDLPKVRAFVAEQLKIDAEPGDTVVVFTIGHGGGGGDLMTLGQRTGAMHALAGAAEDAQQHVLWWQLSCHAMAKLPTIDTLPAAQQDLFCMVASSPANEESAAGVQGKIMEKVFMALAERGRDIDPDQDGVITAKELGGFLKSSGNSIGDRVFAKTPDSPMFGGSGNLANLIPIVDRNGPQGNYPRGYIPMPGHK